MKKVFITDFDSKKFKPRDLFPLVRPFLNKITGKWEIKLENLKRWNCSESTIKVANSINDADFIFVSEPLNHNHDVDKHKNLEKLNLLCVQNNIMAYVFVEGDYGKVHPQYTNIVYFRMGGFKTQLDKNNLIFFPLISDQLKKIFNRESIILRDKNEMPIVGFCGHASVSFLKLLFEKIRLIKINFKRALVKDFFWEPLFSSAYERLKILKSLAKSNEINTNFIFRERYRAGSSSKQDQVRTTEEYFNNILESDYIICLRGSGNFSVRFYETLMMGRIPVFVNTDCLLPLEDEIDWKQHVVWVEWKDRHNISSIISDFHKNISNEKFVEMQKENREIWLSKLSINYYLNKLANRS